MGVLHPTYVPKVNGEIEKFTMQFGVTKEITNDDLMWQIRLCEKPGEVKVIAAFKECEDAIEFMTHISKNKGHGFITSKKMIVGFGLSAKIYSIEHNSSTEYVEKTYKTKQRDTCN